MDCDLNGSNAQSFNLALPDVLVSYAVVGAAQSIQHRHMSLP
jgi:hypothetical protein